MAGFDDNLVREYFELNGFFTRTSAKPAGSARTRRAEEPGDLLVLNPSPRAGLTPGFQLFGADLAGLGSAVIAIKGLTASKALTPAMLRRGDFLEFIRKEATVAAKEAFAEIPEPAEARPARVLVLPGLPAQEPPRSESIALLRDRGVDHVLTFRTILENLIQAAEAGAASPRSDTLQLLRLLRAYDMVNAAQLELFGQPPFK
ncbi:hypothetical protein LBMAG55_01410 [Verrucomicrobiota bacterium]|nr:hypothetical protein LBMAG55_01410 [Verrucomicrobiota bacterium]